MVILLKGAFNMPLLVVSLEAGLLVLFLVLAVLVGTSIGAVVVFLIPVFRAKKAIKQA